MAPTYLWLILAPLSLVHRYLVLQDEACLLMGRRIASPEVLKVNKNGFKESLMIPEQTKWYFLVQALILAAGVWLLLGFGWVEALVGVAIWFFVGVLATVLNLLPKVDSQHYRIQILSSMGRRYANYI